MDLIDQLRNLSVSHRRSLRDDDFFIDRLHHRYTVAILVVFCVVVTAHQYAGEPINCWVPSQFTSSFETYTNRLCWLQNTYYVHENEDIPDDHNERAKTSLKYYQWVHLILLFQALLFIIPRIIWRSLNDKCGIEIINYVDAAMKYEMVDKYHERDKIMDFLSNHIYRFIKAKDAYRTNNNIKYKIKRTASYICFWTGKRFGNYLLILYAFCKLLYLANVIGQLFLMTHLLGIENYHSFGIEILKRIGSGLDMVSSSYFPKVSHCDFKVRELGNDHHYTVQCVLVINIFTEKIYVLLWFWFVLLAALTGFDFFRFILYHFVPAKRHHYISKHIKIFNEITNDSTKKSLRKFISSYLKPDVVFVLHVIAGNVNAMIVSEVADRLWRKYCEANNISPDDHEVPNSNSGEDYQMPAFPNDTAIRNGSNENGENVQVRRNNANNNPLYSNPQT